MSHLSVVEMYTDIDNTVDGTANWTGQKTTVFLQEGRPVRIVNIDVNKKQRLGFEQEGHIYVFDEEWAIEHRLPVTLEDLFANHADVVDHLALLANMVSRQIEGAHVTSIPATDAIYYAPVPKGRKIICVGLNYQKHAAESALELPKVPLLFSKFDNTLTGHNAVVKKPFFTDQMDYEAEVCVVIGRKASHVSPETALDYVLGYANANDLSARDAQFVTSQWLLGKTCDGFCPVGPALVTADEVLDPTNLRVQCFVNGEVRQDSTTSLMIFSFQELISYISRHLTLEPGDMILSGTPDGVILGKPQDEQIWLQQGDEVVVEVEHLGRLRVQVG